MIEKFQKRLEKLIPDYANKKYLLAVSGGPDSVAMLRLSAETGLDALIAHCNFHLRGDEADKDEVFTEMLAKKFNYEFVKTDFDTKKYAEENGLSTQMAARELRYEWFEKTRKITESDYIMIAHNRGDVAETVLINQIRGCGIRGVSGITEIKGRILRPMLFISRDEIEQYLKKIDQNYRIDKSNAETKYMRNAVRHKVLPEMKKINKQIENTLHENALRAEKSVKTFEKLLEKEKSRLFKIQADGIKISIEKDTDANLLYELLRDFGFNYTSVIDLYESKTAGKQVFSENYILQKDRTYWWLIKKNTDKSIKSIKIDKTEFNIEYPIKLKSKIKSIKDISINNDPKTAQLDAEKIKLPLNLRHKKEGDKFRPLGMNGFQKLKDYFINNKLSLNEKENTFLLCCGEDIIWIVGMQIDDRYKITNNTTKVLEIKYFD